MLLGISFIMVLVYTFYFNRVASAKKQDISTGLGRCIAMALGMVSGVTLGLILAVQLPDLLAVSTLSSILISAVLVFFIGRPFGLAGIIEALSSSLMGAMMGAMLGAMLQQPWIPFMVASMDAIYIITVFSLTFLMNKGRKPVQVNKPVSFLITLILPLCIIGTAALIQANGDTGGNKMMMNNMQHMHQE